MKEESAIAVHCFWMTEGSNVINTFFNSRRICQTVGRDRKEIISPDPNGTYFQQKLQHELWFCRRRG